MTENPTTSVFDPTGEKAIVYRVARRQRIEGPWQRFDDVEYATYAEAAEACETARQQTGIPYEIEEAEPTPEEETA